MCYLQQILLFYLVVFSEMQDLRCLVVHKYNKVEAD